MGIINTPKLSAELLAASLPISGVDSDANITWQPGHPSPAEAAQAAAVVAAHDPNPYAITSHTKRIAANGEDAAVITVCSTGESAALLVNGAPVDVQLVNNIGTLLVTSDSPGTTIHVTGASTPLSNHSATVYAI